MKTTYIQDPETGKFIEKSKYQPPDTAAVHTMQPFVSPVDGTVIRDSGQLRAHNRKHGVTDRRDYGESWFERKRGELEAKRQGTDKQSKQERINALNQTYEQLRK